ncbi:hypothetical protein [Actinoplanes sp. M2I2]|nr:hypothetical protein [Actinoplanes sp. M2I2]
MRLKSTLVAVLPPGGYCPTPSEYEFNAIVCKPVTVGDLVK